MTGEPPPADGDAAAPQDEELPWPVGFIVLASLAALYVGWRVIQLIIRGLDALF